MALLRSAGHGAPPCQAPSSLAPQRLPSTHPVNSSTYPGPVLPLSTLFSTILHYIPRGQGSIITRLSCSFYHCFYFHARDFRSTRGHTVSIALLCGERITQPARHAPTFIFCLFLFPPSLHCSSLHLFLPPIQTFNQPASQVSTHLYHTITHPSVHPSIRPSMHPSLSSRHMLERMLRIGDIHMTQRLTLSSSHAV